MLDLTGIQKSKITPSCSTKNYQEREKGVHCTHRHFVSAHPKASHPHYDGHRKEIRLFPPSDIKFCKVQKSLSAHCLTATLLVQLDNLGCCRPRTINPLHRIATKHM